MKFVRIREEEVRIQRIQYIRVNIRNFYKYIREYRVYIQKLVIITLLIRGNGLRKQKCFFFIVNMT